MSQPTTWISVLLCLLAAMATAPRPAAGEDGALYFRRGLNVSDLQLLMEPSTRDDDRRQMDADLRAGEAASFGIFLSDGAARHVPGGAVSALVFVGTGAEGMMGCAEVTVSLARRSPAGGDAVLATATLHDAYLEPKNDDPPPVEIQLGTIAPLTLAAGERLAASVSVRNLCGSHRGVTLRFDAIRQLSRVILPDNCPAVPNLDQRDDDGDGI